MFDLMTLAFQTDSTRIITFLMAIEQSNRAYREIGIADSHHGLTHHGGDKEKIDECIRINRYQVEQFAYFIGKLKATKDGDATLFDHGDGYLWRRSRQAITTTTICRRCLRAGATVCSTSGAISGREETPLAKSASGHDGADGCSGRSFADSTGKLDYLSSL